MEIILTYILNVQFDAPNSFISALHFEGLSMQV